MGKSEKLKKVDVLCINCKINTEHNILETVSRNFRDDEEYWWYDDEYQIIECAGCKAVSFRIEHTDAELFSHWEPETGMPQPFSERIYPLRSKDALESITLSDTPESIKDIYEETIKAYNNQQLILCCAGLRAIIEGICLDKGVTKGEVPDLKKGGTRISSNLDGKIEGLYKEGHLTKGNAEILHNLRFIGNEALHELTPPTKSELDLAIDIIQHTLGSLYEIESKAKHLKHRMTIRKSKPKS